MENEIFGLDLPAELTGAGSIGFCLLSRCGGVCLEVAASVPRPEASGRAPSTFSDLLCDWLFPSRIT